MESEDKALRTWGQTFQAFSAEVLSFSYSSLACVRYLCSWAQLRMTLSESIPIKLQAQNLWRPWILPWILHKSYYVNNCTVIQREAFTILRFAAIEFTGVWDGPLNFVFCHYYHWCFPHLLTRLYLHASLHMISDWIWLSSHTHFHLNLICLFFFLNS